MKVGIDYGPLKSGDAVRGIGVYVKELLSGLRVEGIDAGASDLSKYEIVHFTSFKPFSISLPPVKPESTKFVMTIYDLIPLIYPKHYPPGIKGRLNWEKNKNLIRKNVDAIITISETSKKDICRFLGVDPKIVYVTYLAPRKVFRRLVIGDWELETKKRYGLPHHFVLYVGDINYNKNIPNLITACKLARSPLVIAGKQAAGVEIMNLSHPELKHLKGVDWLGVTRPGFVGDEDLVKIYNMADCYIQPSFYEGFGLPVLEAVACKVPVVATRTQALIEILGDAFDYVDAKDPKSIAEGILKPNRDRKLPETYSWEKTIKETFDIYNSVMQ